MKSALRNCLREGRCVETIRIKQAVIVEGKYDKIKLSQLLDTVIVTTDGFSVFRDKEKQQLIRRLAQTRGLLVLTDSDSAGFMIRSFIGGSVPQNKVIHAYIPDIFGKERRKTEYSKEGKLGVEGVSIRVIMSALEKAGVICEETGGDDGGRRLITNVDLYEDGFSGTQRSKEKRQRLLEYFALPSRLSSGSLISVLNTFATYEEYRAAAAEINRCFGETMESGENAECTE